VLQGTGFSLAFRERAVKELRRATAILRKVLAYLLRHSKPESLGTTANGDGVYRGAPRGTGYRAALPGTGATVCLAARPLGTNMLLGESLCAMHWSRRSIPAGPVPRTG
jgi:hypothetical protein